MTSRNMEMEIKNKKLFARGKRGIVSTAFLGRKKVAIKEKRFSSKAEFAIEKEAEWLKIFNTHDIGPKFLYFNDGQLIYEFVEGEYLVDFLPKASRKDALSILKNVLMQCRKLDELGINKFEMTRPRKHVIVSKKRNKLLATMIDFERCRRTERPKNVTQFCQFLISAEMQLFLAGKNIKIERHSMISLAQKYKSNQTRNNFAKIAGTLK